jgi:hypothetical protein
MHARTLVRTIVRNMRVAVWGTGNVGQPALRAVVSHHDLELAAVIVSSEDKVGKDAGELCGISDTGVLATMDVDAVLADVDAVVYCASGDFRPIEALKDIERCLRQGCDVVTTSAYPLLHPPTAPEGLKGWFGPACEAGNSSCFVSGIDPGWAQDVLPVLLSGVSSDITEIRCQELFNYAYYDAPDAVRQLCGFGLTLDRPPPMVAPGAPTIVWGPMLHTMAEAFGLELTEIVEVEERLPLAETVEVGGMGEFEAGTQGALKFEVRGMVGDRALFVVEHVTRIIDDIAPHWESPPSGKAGAHRLIISGRPDITFSIEAEDGDNNPASGGNATAANRIVNALPAVINAPQGLLGALDLPSMNGAKQLRLR